jgi:hypothetical protein
MLTELISFFGAAFDLEDFLVFTTFFEGDFVSVTSQTGGHFLMLSSVVIVRMLQ